LNGERIILASASPRRKEILDMVGLQYECLPANIDESEFLSLPPDIAVMQTARKKANAVRGQVSAPAIIIAADTVCYLNGIIGKPADEEDAERILRMFSDTVHSVYTGIYVLDNCSGKECVRFSETKVLFSALSDDDIHNYVLSGEPMDKAGAYAIQGLASKFIRSIDGCFYNVVGLPISELRDMLKLFGINI